MNRTEKVHNHQRMLSGQRRSSYNYIFASAITSCIMAACLLGNPLQLFVIKLGASVLEIGMLSFFISFSSIFTLTSISAMERNGKSKVLFLGSMGTTIALFFLIFMPILKLFHPDYTQIIIFLTIFIIAVRGVFEGYASTGWLPLLQDNIPARMTGAFLSRLSKYCQASMLAAVWLISLYFGKNATYGKFTVVFVVGFVFLIVKTMTLQRVSELPVHTAGGSKTRLSERIFTTLKTRPFRVYIIYVLFYNIALFAPMPFIIKMLKNLSYSDSYIMVATSMIQLAPIFTIKFIGKLADKYGNRVVFTTSITGAILTSFLWLAVDNNPFSKVFVFVLYFLWGLFCAANAVAQNRYVIHTVPRNSQSSIVIMNMSAGLAMAIAPMAGGLFLSHTGNWNISTSLIEIDNYKMLYILSGLCLIIPYKLRTHLRAANDTPTSQVMMFITRPLIQTFGTYLGIWK